ncbi:autoinducer binding domain-containing protein [Jannaschia sp. S6380]|uniref:helix-turn-helix transcriptional regulator n=1 Tax=Jannaschia sp. S6380 TaxID=2926408 RepID=UPI001FF60475|nr:autoinducer binding domain-containing protein [Jannaschia sp. S6380]MCK0165958.1 autoinducer binding domain-containing protein [Jannaschia sp. S6380]
MSERRRKMVEYLQRLGTLAPMGYSAGIQIRFATPLYMRSTYPQAWQNEYAENAYSLRDPLVFWGISKTGSIRWSEITLPDPFGVLASARAHGLTYGAVTSCGKITSRTIVGIARADREFEDDEIAEAAAIAAALHEVTDAPKELTPVTAEALSLVSDGMTSGAAAARLGISEGAFEARLKSARSDLGVATTAEALRMAREFKLI